jgi:hypothetical protein
MLLYEFDLLIMFYCSVARLRSCSLAMGVFVYCHGGRVCCLLFAVVFAFVRFRAWRALLLQCHGIRGKLLLFVC